MLFGETLFASLFYKTNTIIIMIIFFFYKTMGLNCTLLSRLRNIKKRPIQSSRQQGGGEMWPRSVFQRK